MRERGMPILLAGGARHTGRRYPSGRERRNAAQTPAPIQGDHVRVQNSHMRRVSYLQPRVVQHETAQQDRDTQTDQASQDCGDEPSDGTQEYGCKSSLRKALAREAGREHGQLWPMLRPALK